MYRREDGRELNLLEKALPVLRKLPVDTYFDFSFGGERVNIQATTQAKVREIRAALGGRWAKRFDESMGWWEYVATRNGIEVQLYACKEGPPRCKAIEEEVEVEKEVAVQWETRTVVEKRVRWECPEKANG